MIEVEQLTKTYPGGVEAVKQIDFEVAPGEMFGLLGPNGAGKSTTIGMLITTVAPTSGRAAVAGHDVASDSRAARGASGIVFQDPVVDSSLSGRDNLKIHARLWGMRGRDSRGRTDEILEAFALTELLDRPVNSYSGGQRRRLEIARALITSPRVLFLDEPTVGLDPRMRSEVLDLLAGLREEEELTVLLTTHYLDEAERLCDRIAVMHEGRIAAIDTPKALLEGLGKEMVELRVDGDASHAMATLRARGIAGDNAISVGSTVTIPLQHKASTRTVAAIAALDLGSTEIAARRVTLDDVYLRLTGSQLAA